MKYDWRWDNGAYLLTVTEGDSYATVVIETPSGWDGLYVMATALRMTTEALCRMRR